jgi:hypothetical protein
LRHRFLAGDRLEMVKPRCALNAASRHADVWGSKATSSLSCPPPRDDLAIADDLVLPMKA